MTAPTITRSGHRSGDDQTRVAAAGTDSAATRARTTPKAATSLPPNLPADQTTTGTHRGVVGGDQATGASGHRTIATHARAAAAPVHTSTTPASVGPEPKGATPGVV